jgi:hypothetical protein
MVQLGGDPNRFLYHGTLRRHLKSIRETGLLPQRGAWVVLFHSGAAALVYAVDSDHRSAAILAMAGQMALTRLVQVPEEYSFDSFKCDLLEHGAIVVVKGASFTHHPFSLVSGHPTGAEPGNWYCSEPVSIDGELVGEEMLTWLKPIEQDFVYRYRPHMLKAQLGN